MQCSKASFDLLVSAHEDRGWYIDAEHFGDFGNQMAPPTLQNELSFAD